MTLQRFRWATILFLGFFFFLGTLQAQGSENLPFIKLKAGDLQLEKNVENYRPADAGWTIYNLPDAQFRCLVLQFMDSPTEEERLILSEAGITLKQYLPHYAYLAEVPVGMGGSRLRQLGVAAVTALPPQFKMAHDVYETVVPDHALTDEADRVWIEGKLLEGYTSEEYLATLSKLGWQMQEQVNEAGFVRLAGNLNRIYDLAMLPFIEWISWPEPEPIPFNIDGFRRHGNGAVARATGLNLKGEGVAVGIGDGGYVAPHVDMLNRVTNLTQSNISSFGNHGDHVAGTVGGAGNRIWRHAGMAPRSSLLAHRTTSIWSQTGNWFNTYGMVLTNNSYGAGFACSNRGTYTGSSVTVDRLAQDYPAVLHVFAAGNDGGQTCAPYPRRYLTVNGSYTSSKNNLAVGALSTTGGLTGFSSRGPTVDGRIKPEICAIGSGLTSTIPTNNYGGKSGTSMAAPTVTGSLALLYEHFRKTTGLANPDGRLIKGIALNTAEDLGNPGPDFFFGFGEMNTLKASEVITNGWYSTNTISQGQSQTGTTINVPANAAELRVMIIWTDEPGASSAAVALVNDLDLTLTNPSGQVFQPWVLDTAAANVGNNATRGIDRLNNVEQVTITNPVAGNYVPNIQGFNIPQGPQEYFVIYEIRSRSIEMLHPVGGEGLDPGRGVQIWWDADGLSGGNLVQDFSSDGGATWSQLGTTNLTTRRRSWTPPNTPTHEARIRVRHSNGNTVAESEDFTILDDPGGLSVAAICRGYLDLSWNSVNGADYYEVMLLDTVMKVVDTTSATSYTLGGLDPTQTYWVTVRARMNSGNPGPRAEAIQAQPNGTGPCPWPYDLSVNTVIEPSGSGRAFSSSALRSNENVRISVQNNGSDTVSVIPLAYQINGGAIINDTMRFTLLPGSSRAHNFSTPADLSAAGFHNIVAWVSLAADTFKNNDTAYTQVKQLANDTIFLPFSEGFEGSFPVAYLDTAFGLDFLDRVDFGSDDPTGRLRTDAGFGFPHTGNRALTLDVSGNVYCTNYAYVTVNMSAYSGAQGILMDFWYMHHSEESHPEDKVHIRGSENDSWIQVYDWYANRASTGNYRQVTGIDLSNALTTAGQSFSSTTQIRIGQHDNFDASTTSATDGVTFDDFRIYFGTPPPFSLICPGDQQLFPFGNNCSASMPDYTAQVQIIGTGAPSFTQIPAPGTAITGRTAVTIQGVLNGDTSFCSLFVDLTPFTVSASATQVSCFGAQDGSARVLGGTQGGRGDTYRWSNGDSTQTITGLASGQYSVTVTNSAGCTATTSVFVSQPASIIVNHLVNDESIPGANDGAIDLTVIGGTAPYSYNWAHGPSTEDLTGLAPGWYYVTVTDTFGCTAVDSAEVLAATASCFQEINGLVSMEAENFHRQTQGAGNAANHLWSNYTDNNASNGRALQALPNSGVNVQDDTIGPRLDYQIYFTQTGSYTVYVRSKANGGTDDSYHAGLNGVPATYGGTGLGRNNTTWGWAASVSGGGPGTVTINVPTTGLHMFSIWMREDGAEIDKIILTQGAAPTGLGAAESPRGNCGPVIDCSTLQIDLQISPESCAGLNDGQASVTVAGGGGNYTYWWSTGDTSTSISNLAPNIYFFRVTHTGCPDSVMLVLIDQADPILLNPAITSPTAPFAGNGAIQLNPSGGRAPYSIVWGNGDTSRTRTGLNEGLYYVTLTDSSGCILTDTFNLVAPSPVVTFEYGTALQVGEQWQRVSLQERYDTMVIIATPVLPNGSVDPVVSRVRALNDHEFEIRVQNPGGTTNDRYDMTWFVVESGVYNVAQHGITMEARVVPSSAVSHSGGWQKNPRAYAQSYTNPIVLGQVMSNVDANWSVFWSSAANNNVSAPTANSFAAGYHVGQDPNTQRQQEELGIVVIEEGNGILQGVPFEAKLGADQVLGVENSALGYQYTTNMSSRIVHAVLSSSGMDGGDGGWPVLFGFQPFTDSIFSLAIDEDQIRDNERRHTTEEVAYLAFGDTSVVTTGPQLVGGRLDNVTEAWQTVSLPNLYRNMVVVASHILPSANNAPAVVRVRLTNNPNQFQIRLQRAGGGPVGPYTVYYFAAEAGIYSAASGIKMEVRKINAPQPASTGNWNQRTAMPYGQAYQNPVVIGQVMGFNDTLWSNFWACGSGNTQAPNPSRLQVGRHTGSNVTINRPAESLGYFVIESGSHTVGNDLFMAGLGADVITGVDNPGTSPFYQVALPDSAVAAVVSTAGMQGNDGGWPVMWQSQPNNDHLYLAIEEDQESDAERAHTTEQVAYFIWRTLSFASNHRIGQEVSNDWLQLYPNPASSEVTLSFPEIETGQVVLVNSLGQSILTSEVHQQRSMKLNISDLAPGMYIVQVRGGDRLMQRSLIVR